MRTIFLGSLRYVIMRYAASVWGSISQIVGEYRKATPGKWFTALNEVQSGAVR